MDCKLLKFQELWNTTHQNSSIHEKDSVIHWIQWVPLVMVAFGSIIRVFYFPLEVNNLCLRYMRMIMTIVTATLAIFCIGQTIHDSDSVTRLPETNHVNRTLPIAVLLTLIIEQYMSWRSSSNFVRTHQALIYAMPCVAIGVVIKLYFDSSIRTKQESYIIHKTLSLQVLTLVSYFVLVVLRLIERQFFEEKAKQRPTEPSEKQISPESQASLLSLVTFSWMTPLIRKGYKHTLKQQDLYPLPRENSTVSVVPHFEKYWKEEVDRAKRKLNNSTDCTTKNDRTQHMDASLLVCLCKAYGPILLSSAVHQLLFNIADLVCPIVLSSLIAYTRETGSNPWRGYGLAGLMFILTILKTIFINHNTQQTQIAGRRNWIALTSAIYKKTLKLSNSAKKATTVGDIINLMSVDAGKISECMWSVNDVVWGIPVKFILAIYLLWQTLGTSIVFGTIVIMLLIPINTILIKKSKILNRSINELTDLRIKTMNEVLNGIKVLKMYAWEESFEKRILDLRNKELKEMEKKENIQTWLHLLWASSRYIFSSCTFAAFILMDDHNILTAEKAFVSLSLFHSIHWALHALPEAINNFSQASVSLKRIQSFLNSDELDETIVVRDISSEYGVVVKDGNFSWENSVEPILKGINIKIPDGTLVAVVGSVGSGKSSLLSAILGEMETTSAKIQIKGSIAYVAQQAWIMNTTLKENILFGENDNKNKYDTIIDATALRPDIDMLSGGDKTEIGEKGINLSGGQKQRVSLARAVYQNADIYLLDDPLSAVDSHVGKHIFDEVIGNKGLLKNKTRILVTHGLSFLPKVDMIITLVDGKIGEMGTFQQLLDHNGPFSDFLDNYMSDISKSEELDEDLTDMRKAYSSDNEDGIRGLKKLAEIVQRKRTVSEFSKDENIGGTNEQTDFQINELIRKQTSGNRELSHDKSGDKQLNDMFLTDNDIEPKGDSDDEIIHGNILSRQISDISDRGSNLHEKLHLSRQTSSASENDQEGKRTTQNRLIEDETIEEGSVKLDVVMTYARAVGLKVCIFILLTNMVHEVAEVYMDVWVTSWANDAASLKNGTSVCHHPHMRLTIYAGIIIFRGIIIFATETLVVYGLLNAAKTLHGNLLRSILKSPMSFFDTTPIGRIVNRFSKDLDTIDNRIIVDMKDSFISLFCLIFYVFVISTASPLSCIIVLPVGVLYFYVQRLFTCTSRQLRRLESAARSPVFAHFGETISGCSTIRAYQKQDTFAEESVKRCEEVNTCQLLKLAARRWTHIRMDTIGSVIVLFVCLCTVWGRDRLSPGLVGLCISYSLHATSCLYWLVRSTANSETEIVSIERIKEYTEISSEAAWEIQETKPKMTWPESGCLHIKDFGVRYREGLDLVLKGITCNIRGGEKVGIVGRTGAGKSSLTMGLFRIIEKAQGQIVIDGIDISTIGLKDLRSKITIIPQDPVLFSGTMRMNIDPFEEYSTEAIWTALEHAHLKTFVDGLPGKLEYECTEGGENISVGQRQLVCLARALLRKTKVLVLDEATAAVDLETDELIQKTIRREFVDCTILTIAHRLNTILDYDRIMVLESGTIKEFDTPSVLLNNKNSLFYGMATHAGLAV